MPPRHDVTVAIEALARDDDQQSHQCQESAARARRSGTPRRPREQRYRQHRKRATVSMPWLCSARPLPDHKQRRIRCPVSNDQPTAVRTIASALQFEHSLRAQSRSEHHARRPSRATAMRPGAIVRVRTRFDVQTRLSALWQRCFWSGGARARIPNGLCLIVVASSSSSRSQHRRCDAGSEWGVVVRSAAADRGAAASEGWGGRGRCCSCTRRRRPRTETLDMAGRWES